LGDNKKAAKEFSFAAFGSSIKRFDSFGSTIFSVGGKSTDFLLTLFL